MKWREIVKKTASVILSASMVVSLGCEVVPTENVWADEVEKETLYYNFSEITDVADMTVNEDYALFTQTFEDSQAVIALPDDGAILQFGGDAEQVAAGNAYNGEHPEYGDSGFGACQLQPEHQQGLVHVQKAGASFDTCKDGGIGYATIKAEDGIQSCTKGYQFGTAEGTGWWYGCIYSGVYYCGPYHVYTYDEYEFSADDIKVEKADSWTEPTGETVVQKDDIVVKVHLQDGNVDEWVDVPFYDIASSDNTVDPTTQDNKITVTLGKITKQVEIVEGHKHVFSEEWTSDETSHWHACTADNCDGTVSDKAEHIASDWIVDKEATETAEGSQHKECTVCKKVLETEAIDKLPHKHVFSEEWTSDETSHWHACTAANCDGTVSDKADHIASDWIVDKEATETAEGSRHKECTVCKKVLETEAIDKLPHNHVFSEEWTSDETSHWHVCTAANCDGTVSDKAEHIASGWIIDQKATETAEGSRHKECTVCKKVLVTSTIPKNASEDGTVTVTEPKVAEGAPKAELSSDADQIKKSVELTPEEEEAVEQGAIVDIYLQVESKDSTITPAEKEMIEKAKEDYTVGTYFDASLYKKVGSADAVEVDALKDKVKLQIELPETLKNADSNVTRSYSLIGINESDGKAEIINVEYDEKTGTFTFETDKFTTYAIAYKDVVKEVNDNTTEKQEKLSGNDIAALDLPLLMVKGIGGNKKISLSWEKDSQAEGYEVYWSYCNGKQNFKLLKDSKKLKVTHSKLNNAKAYKYFVVSYKLVDGEKVYLQKSASIHVAMSKQKKTNASKITVKKAKYTLKKNKSVQISAKTVKVEKKKAVLTHAKEFRYFTSDKKIATVSKTGKITAKKKGSCKVYVMANNGVYKTIKVTVK